MNILFSINLNVSQNVWFFMQNINKNMLFNRTKKKNCMFLPSIRFLCVYTLHLTTGFEVTCILNPRWLLLPWKQNREKKLFCFSSEFFTAIKTNIN